MKVWTVLNTIEEYQQLIGNGYLCCDDSNKDTFLYYEGNIEKQFKLGYDWISTKLREHTLNLLEYRQKFNIDMLRYPRWVWVQIEGKKNWDQIDKCFYSRIPKDYKVLIFNINENKLLLSDYDLWHCCLNISKICNNEHDDDEFYDRLKKLDLKTYDLFFRNFDNYLEKDLIYKLRKEIIDSWDEIFDIEDETEFCRYKNEEKTIQGNVWVLEKKDLIDVIDLNISQEDVDKYNEDV